MSEEIKTQSDVSDAAPKKPSDDGLVISLGVAILIIVGGFFYLTFGGAHERPASAETLHQRCDSANGIFVEGMNGVEGDETHFSLCIPERAFECIDVE